MRRAHIYAFLCTALVGCTNWSEDLDKIQSDKRSCASFQRRYNEVKPKTNTNQIDMKIKECKELGAWEEVSGDKDKPSK